MTLLDAAEKVITEARRPMGVKELCESEFGNAEEVTRACYFRTKDC